MVTAPILVHQHGNKNGLVIYGIFLSFIQEADGFALRIFPFNMRFELCSAFAFCHGPCCRRVLSPKTSLIRTSNAGRLFGAHRPMTRYRAVSPSFCRQEEYQSLNLQALNNPFMSGVAVQINWRDIEPVQGKPDWSKLDELFAAAESSKKWVQLAHLSRLLFSCMGAGRRKDRPVRDSIWARPWHRREPSNAMGSRVPRPLVRIRETTERKVRKVARV